MTISDTIWSPTENARIARAFLILGRMGFWVQFVFLIVVGLLGAYTTSVIGWRAGAGTVLAILGLAVPAFTTWWCWRYGKLGRDLAIRPSAVRTTGLLRSAWIGVWAGTLGSAIALLSLFGAASALLVVMLANPQVGIQVSPATAGVSAYTISAVDAVSIMALLLTLTAELLVIAISLRLVFLFPRTPQQRDA